jgi:hypothetical protein
LKEGCAARLDACFEDAQALQEANGLLALAGHLYAKVSQAEQEPVEIHPGLERQLFEAGEKEIPL